MSLQSKDMTTSDYLAILRRRWRPTVAVMAIVALGTIYIAYSLPAVYQSSATILIEQQGIPTDFVQSSINAYAEQLLQTIYQRVLVASNVHELIEKHDLYPDERPDTPNEELFNLFRDSTIMSPKNVTTVHARTGREATITFGFQIDFLYSDPVKTRDVAREIAEMFVSYNATLRSETASRTTAFLDTESDSLEERLSDVSKRMAQYQEEHANNLPEDQEVALRTEERLSNELTMLDSQLRNAREQKALLETDIANTPLYRPVLDSSGAPVLGGVDRLAEAQQELMSLLGRYNENHPDVVRLRREIATLDPSSANQAHLKQQLQIELQARQRELSAARETYSESHPDVVDLRNEVNSLNAQLHRVESTPSSDSLRANNPAYLQLRTRIRTTREELADLSRRRTVITGRLVDLERLRLASPQVERAYTALTSERDLLLERYRELRELEGEAALGEALETGQSGERLVIVEPPRIPVDPVSPNRASLSFLGVILGIALGLGSASLAESMDTKIRGRRDIYELLEAPPIAIIPYVESRSDTVKRRAMNAAMTAAIFGAAAYVITAAI